MQMNDFKVRDNIVVLLDRVGQLEAAHEDVVRALMGAEARIVRLTDLVDRLSVIASGASMQGAYSYELVAEEADTARDDEDNGVHRPTQSPREVGEES